MCKFWFWFRLECPQMIAFAVVADFYQILHAAFACICLLYIL